MALAYASAILDVTADTAWTVVRDFDGLPTWHPGINTSTLDDTRATEVGAVRTLTLADGATVREQLIALNDHTRSYRYNMLDGPFPIRSYHSTIHLHPVTETGQCYIEWYARFDAEAADETTLATTFGDGVFAAGLAGLRHHLAS